MDDSDALRRGSLAGPRVDADNAWAGYRLDLSNELLIRGAEELPLRPKTFAVLRHLASRPGQLVTKCQLLDSVWTDSYVSDMVLRVSIRELRKVLDDDPRTPRYIRTVHGRGYRLIGHLAITRRIEPTSRFHGGKEEPDLLRACLGKALDGERQVVFVTGGHPLCLETLLAELLDEGYLVCHNGLWRLDARAEDVARRHAPTFRTERDSEEL